MRSKRFPACFALSVLLLSLAVAGCGIAGSPVPYSPAADLASPAAPADLVCAGFVGTSFADCNPDTCLPKVQVWKTCATDGRAAYHAPALDLKEGRLSNPTVCGVNGSWVVLRLQQINPDTIDMRDCDHKDWRYVPAPGHGVYLQTP